MEDVFSSDLFGFGFSLVSVDIVVTERRLVTVDYLGKINKQLTLTFTTFIHP